MPQVDPVILQLRADVATYNRNVEQAERLTDRRLSAMEKRGEQMGLRISNSMNLAGKAALSFAAGFVTIDLARRFIAIGDEAKKLDAQLRLATAGFGSFEQAQKDVQRIAATTRSGLSETAALYGNFARSSKEMGASQADASRATETFSKTLKISGADANQAASATLQFGQALAAGALRGDELNSILEASPRLSRLLAESMNMPIGQIKALGEQGALTSDKLLRALTEKKFTDGIDREFRELPVTFDDAMSQVENAAIITFGAFDRGGRFSNALASFVTDGATGFGDLEKSAEEFGIKARAEIEGLAGAFAPVIAEAQRLFGMIDSRDWSKTFSFEQDTKDIDKFTRWFSQQGVGGGLLTGNSFSDSWNGKATGTNFHGRYVRDRAASEAESRRILAAQTLKDRMAGTGGTWFSPGAGPAKPAPPSPSGKPAGRSGPSAETLAKRAEAERLREIRDEASSARESARLDDDILAAKAALATAAESILQFRLDANDSERKQRNADVETEVKLGNLGREEADRRILINNHLSQLQNDLARRQAAEAIAARNAAAAQDEINTSQAEAQLIEAREKRRDAELRILELAYKEEEAAIRRAAANGEIADLDEALANMKRRQAVAVEGVQRQGESPFARYMRDLRTEAVNVGDAFEEAAVNGIDRINDGLAESATKALGFRGILGDILSDLIKIAFRSQVLGGGGGGGLLGALGSLVGIGSKAIGGNTAGLESNFDKVFGRASGGNVNGGQMYRVNEGASPGRVEAFVPKGSGDIIPLGRMDAIRGGGSTVQNITIKVDAQGALLAGQVEAMVQKGMGMAAQIGVNGGGALGESRIMSRGRRRIPG